MITTSSFCRFISAEGWRSSYLVGVRGGAERRGQQGVRNAEHTALGGFYTLITTPWLHVFHPLGGAPGGTPGAGRKEKTFCSHKASRNLWIENTPLGSVS